MKKTSENEKLAVALKYPENAPAPFVTAAGRGHVAEKIIKAAEENNVNVHYDEEGSLVKFLSSQQIGSYVPEQAWDALAAVFAFMFSEGIGDGSER